MENHLSVADTGIPGGELIDKVASELGHNLLVSAKSKFAQKTADKGNYWTLRSYLKNLIKIPQYIIDQVKGQGITYYAILQIPAQGIGASNTQIINLLKQVSGQGDILHADPKSQAAKPESQMTVGSDGQPELTKASDGILNALPMTKTFKKYLPYIIGIVLFGIIVYLIVKYKK